MTARKKPRKPMSTVMLECHGGPLDGTKFTYRGSERIVVPGQMNNQLGQPINHAYVLHWAGDRWVWKHDGVED